MVGRVNNAGTCDTVGQLRSTTVARTWEEALVTGNGRQGALCYGDAGDLNVSLSHERLFLPKTEPLPPPETARILPDLRSLLYAGHYREAAEKVCSFATSEDPRYADLRWIDPLIGAAALAFHSLCPVEANERAIDLTTGVVTLRGQTATGPISHDIFVSRPANVVVSRTRADTIEGILSLRPIDEEPPVPIDFTTSATADRLALTAAFPQRWAGAISGYTVTCHVVLDGGQVAVDGDSLVIHGAQELLVLTRIEIVGADGAIVPSAEASLNPDFDLLTAAADHTTLLAEHVSAHRELFDRVSLRLGPTEPEEAAAPSTPPRSTEELLADPTDPELIATLFDAGRYAIISSTGELPPTLQGVWSGTYDPAWSSGYTLNGNLPMAMASAVPTNSPELLLPLFNLLAERMDDFRENARRLYGLDGIVLPTHCSSHGKQNHFGPVWCQTFWIAGAAWMARYFYDYWRTTHDVDFLVHRAIPFMAEAAQFCEGFLVECDSAGTVVFIPSYSPENCPAGTDAQACVNATMDVAAVRDLLGNLLECERAADKAALAAGEAVLPSDRGDRWQTLLKRLPPYQIGPEGQFAEWLWPGLEDNPAHRHTSQLYPLWYGDPDVLSVPSLRAAAQCTIEQRLDWWRGDATGKERPGEMAFGLVMLGLAAARLGLAEPAYEIVTKLAKDYWRPSLVSTHNAGSILNVDICGGMVALVVAMLVGGNGDTLDLLPALPSAWSHGEIRGVAGCDQVTVSRLTWTPDRMEVELTAPTERRITIGIGNTHTAVIVGPDRPTHLIASRERHHAPPPAAGTP